MSTNLSCWIFSTSLAGTGARASRRRRGGGWLPPFSLLTSLTYFALVTLASALSLSTSPSGGITPAPVDQDALPAALERQGLPGLGYLPAWPRTILLCIMRRKASSTRAHKRLPV